jgi:hypothetical protein
MHYFIFPDLDEYYSKLASRPDQTVLTIPESTNNDQDSLEEEEDEEFIAA